MKGKKTINKLLLRACALTVCMLVLGCALQPEKTAPLLLPTADSIRWPLPPEKPRYAYVGTLIGEQDFLAAKKNTNTARSTISWIIGIVFGEPDYVELQRPISGYVDDQGKILVVDASHRAVMVFDMREKVLRKWALAAPNESFINPIAITADGKGGYLVTDAERGEVIRLDPKGDPIGAFGKNILERPTGIARDPRSGTIFVADTGKHDIKLFDANGILFDTLGNRGTSPGQFNAPTHLAFANARLFVTDTLNFRIQVFDTLGDRKLVFGRLGLNVGNLTRPKGVAIGAGGRIYVIESYYDHLLVFNPTGELLIPIGGTGKTEGLFYLPNGVWTDREGRVFVADMFNGRVSVFKELTGSNL